MRCPICKKDVPLDGPEMPFCGKRCRLLDLGNWADETYRISSPADFAERAAAVDSDEDESSNEGRRR